MMDLWDREDQLVLLVIKVSLEVQVQQVLLEDQAHQVNVDRWVPQEPQVQLDQMDKKDQVGKWVPQDHPGNKELKVKLVKLVFQERQDQEDL